MTVTTRRNVTRHNVERDGVRPSSLRSDGRSAPKVPPRAGYEMVQAVLDFCRRHAIPEPDRLARDAVGQQTRNLLQAGYAEADVRSAALELALRFTLYTRHKALMSLQQTVQQRHEDQRIAEHDALKNEPVAPEVAAAIGGLKHVPPKREPRDPHPARAWLAPLPAAGSKCICGHYAIEHAGTCRGCVNAGREAAACGGAA